MHKYRLQLAKGNMCVYILCSDNQIILNLILLHAFLAMRTAFYSVSMSFEHYFSYNRRMQVYWGSYSLLVFILFMILLVRVMLLVLIFLFLCGSRTQNFFNLYQRWVEESLLLMITKSSKQDQLENGLTSIISNWMVILVLGHISFQLNMYAINYSCFDLCAYPLLLLNDAIA